MVRMGERRGASKVLGGNLEGKRQLGRHICRGEGNIKMHFQEIGWKRGMAFMGLRTETKR